MIDDNSPLSLFEFPDHLLCDILEYVGDARFFFRLSWTCRFWRDRLYEDELWHQLLVDQLHGVDREACCGRLCELSGLDCLSLAMAVVSAGQQQRCLRSYAEVVETVDPRKLGIITFLPQRLDLQNTQRVQQACVDAIRWCFATSSRSKSGFFYGKAVMDGRICWCLFIVLQMSFDSMWKENRP